MYLWSDLLYICISISLAVCPPFTDVFSLFIQFFFPTLYILLSSFEPLLGLYTAPCVSVIHLILLKVLVWLTFTHPHLHCLTSLYDPENPRTLAAPAADCGISGGPYRTTPYQGPKIDLFIFLFFYFTAHWSTAAVKISAYWEQIVWFYVVNISKIIDDDRFNLSKLCSFM